MANRSFFRHQTLEREVKTLYSKFTVGTSGVVTATSGAGVTSVTNTASGVYRVLLTDKYPQILTFNGTSTSGAFQVQGPNLDKVAASGIFDLLTTSGGVNVVPASGTSIRLDIHLKNA